MIKHIIDVVDQVDCLSASYAGKWKSSRVLIICFDLHFKFINSLIACRSWGDPLGDN
jgi:hypothetical protein